MATAAQPVASAPTAPSLAQLYGNPGRVLNATLVFLDAIKPLCEIGSAYFVVHRFYGIVTAACSELRPIVRQMTILVQPNEKSAPSISASSNTDSFSTSQIVSETTYLKFFSNFTGFAIPKYICKAIADFPLPLDNLLWAGGFVAQALFIVKNWKITIPVFIIGEVWAVAHQFTVMLNDGSFQDTKDAPKGTALSADGTAAMQKLSGDKTPLQVEKSHIDIGKLFSTTKLLRLLEIPLYLFPSVAEVVQNPVQKFVNTRFTIAGNSDESKLMRAERAAKQLQE